MKDLLRIVADYREWVEGQSRDGLQSPLTARERVAILGFVGWLERTSPEYAAAPELLAALTNIRDTVESCYVAGGWVPLDTEEMESIAAMSNAAIAKAEGEA